MASLSTGASEPLTETQREGEKRVVHGRFLLGLAQKSTTHVQMPPLRTQSCGHTKAQGRLGNVMLCSPEARRDSLVEKCLAISTKIRKGSWLGKGKLEIGESGTGWREKAQSQGAPVSTSIFPHGTWGSPQDSVLWALEGAAMMPPAGRWHKSFSRSGVLIAAGHSAFTVFNDALLPFSILKCVHIISW